MRLRRRARPPSRVTRAPSPSAPPMSQPADREPSASSQPRLADLFIAFSGIAIMGFGGVLPWARRMLVEQRRWLSGEEFLELLSLCQFLPGGNIINLAVVVGQRMRGVAGAVVSVAGLIVGPTMIVLLLGSAFIRYGHLAEVQGALAGVAAAAVGLILAMAAKMAGPLFKRGAGLALAFAVATFVAVAVLRLSLPAVVVVLAPLSIAAAWRKAA
jgi:chromate transporter